LAYQFIAFADAGGEAHMRQAGEAMRATASKLFSAAPVVDYVDIVTAVPA
jgi:hypothetical protein